MRSSASSVTKHPHLRTTTLTTSYQFSLKTYRQHGNMNWYTGQNNNCESMNHILKLNINWIPQSLPTLIDIIHNIVKSQYTNVERAVSGKGEYQLDSKFRHFSVARAAWLKKTPDQKARHLIRMSKALALQNPRQCVTSSDGQRHTYSAPGGGKRPGQVKRKRACRTRTGKDIAVCADSDSE